MTLCVSLVCIHLRAWGLMVYVLILFLLLLSLLYLVYKAFCVTAFLKSATCLVIVIDLNVVSCCLWRANLLSITNTHVSMVIRLLVHFMNSRWKSQLEFFSKQNSTGR